LDRPLGDANPKSALQGLGLRFHALMDQIADCRKECGFAGPVGVS